MPQPIRTKLHHAIELINKDLVFLPSYQNKKARPYSDFEVDKKSFRAMFAQYERAPHFVISDELMEIAASADFRKSMFDMKKAGVLHLPFKHMTVEFRSMKKGGSQGAHFIMYLADLHNEEMIAAIGDSFLEGDSQLDIYGLSSVVNSDEEGDYLVVMPVGIGLGLDLEKVDKNGQPFVYMKSGVLSFLPNNLKVNKVVESVHLKGSSSVFMAASAAYLLMTTEGVEKEVIETTRINRKRRSDGKVLIPQHTYVHIGRVYQSAGSDKSEKYDARKSPRPHWRRGHNRRVRFGTGLTQIRIKFIPGRIVAYDPQYEVPDPPTYVVSL